MKHQHTESPSDVDGSPRKQTVGRRITWLAFWLCTVGTLFGYVRGYVIRRIADVILEWGWDILWSILAG